MATENKPKKLQKVGLFEGLSAIWAGFTIMLTELFGAGVYAARAINLISETGYNHAKQWGKEDQLILDDRIEKRKAKIEARKAKRATQTQEPAVTI